MAMLAKNNYIYIYIYIYARDFLEWHVVVTYTVKVQFPKKNLKWGKNLSFIWRKFEVFKKDMFF